MAEDDPDHGAGEATAADGPRGEQAFYKSIQRLRAALVDCMRRRLHAEEAV
jgi:hypothetical protein